ncbi:carbohydrate ABC transporter substrate-binding protein [Acidaminobacter sp. JC074]|uniref:carbohydrate ABC transporter substrate-binding protein n=1 Tax=Acidaminobacter sp. JC074 TaxID=2530199 RepID=UPI001F0E4D3A|nr:carbohydrate ABC transporter substrate-binding protein [Acidaminobacter sp. JC074]MCH4889395.1 carbohydrate ABC transporter substrate-binding protein [Acidaminobacter sp. JC074]
MKLKKTLSLLMLVSILLSSLFACSDNTENTSSDISTGTGEEEVVQEKIILDVAAFEGGYGRAYWDAVVEAFEKDYPNVEVKLTISPKIVDIIRPRLVAGDAPDYIYAGELDKLLLADNALLPLNDVFDSESLDGDGVKLKDKMIPGFLDYCSPLDDGNIYYAPVYMQVLGMYYNKGLFDENGWDVPVTWDEFFAYAEKGKALDRSLFTYAGIYPIYNQFIYGAMLASGAGVEETNKILNYEKDAWDSPKVKEVLNVFGKIATEGHLMEGTVALNHTQSQTAFMQGQALFIPNGNWMPNEMKDVTPEEGFEFGFMPAPKLNSEDTSYVITSYETHYIPKNAKNPEMAKEFMRYQYKKEMIMLAAKHGGAIMPIKNGVDIVKEYISDSIYNVFSVFDTYGARPLSFQWKVVQDAEVSVEKEFSDAINSLMNGDITVDEWIERTKEANKKVRESMTN